MAPVSFVAALEFRRRRGTRIHPDVRPKVFERGSEALLASLPRSKFTVHAPETRGLRRVNR
jgi:hypothetical protein